MTKSWTEKLQDGAPHQLKSMAVARAGVARGGLMLLPSVRMVDEFIRAIPKGRAVTIAEMRASLARRQRADGCCPVYTGYHLRTCAEAALEAHHAGAPLTRVTPVWRVLDEKAPTLKKLKTVDRALILKQRGREGLD